MMRSRDAITAVIASVSSIALCASSSILFTVAISMIYLKSRSANDRADSDSTIDHKHERNDQSSPEAHVYEAIAPVSKTLVDLEESMDKNIAYGPIHAVCK